MKYLTAIPQAIETEGFWKAVFYSFGSWLGAWLIAWLATSQATSAIGQYGWVIPLFNTIAVFIKEYFDSLSTNKG
jgi:hypothetical protein